MTIQSETGSTGRFVNGVVMPYGDGHAPQRTITDSEASAALRADNDALRAQLEGLEAEHEELKAGYEDLAAALAAKKEAAPAGLPADARERIVAIKGVGEKLADEIIAALSAADTSDDSEG